MENALQNQQITNVTVNQPKVLNLPVPDFHRAVVGRTFQGFRQRGKWILTSLTENWTLAFNLGMGGEISLHNPEEVPDPQHERVVFVLGNNKQAWVHFWWFGHVHAVPTEKLSDHPQLGTLGIEPLSEDFTISTLSSMLENRRGRIKSYLLDQRFIAGIGNVYVQDILWHARLHPNRKANTLEPDDITRLHDAIRLVLQQGIQFGPGPGEQDIFGKKGNWGKVKGYPQIAYRKGESCPSCNHTIEEIRVGSTTSFICPRCQT
jgi:formamidopyrimidine-DNA glycosylase